MSHITHKQQTFQLTAINKNKHWCLHAKSWQQFNT
jgi:hypothetical protein